MRLRSILLNIVVNVIALSALLPRSFGAEQASDLPDWLRAHIGEGEGQIAQVVLQRARALYFQKVHEGAVRNPCYFAMDATRPNDLGDGKLGRRFYVICESDRSFRAISAGHGGGRNLKFREWKTVREELRQCDGFEADRRRGLCNGRDENVFQRLLPGFSAAFIRAV